NISFGGSVGVHAQLGFGYDTFGLRQFKSSGNESKVADGFFLINTPDPEITATGTISIGAGFDAIVASASVEGSLIGTLALDLQDPDNDGKVRFSELEHFFNLGPLCIFDITGSLDLGLSAHAKVGVWKFAKHFNYGPKLLH